MNSTFDISDLRCEHKYEPLGIGVTIPRLAWKMRSDRRGARQTAYQVRAAAHEEALEAGNAGLWDTGRVAADTDTGIIWSGATLTSRQRVVWQVTLWDETGASVTSDLSSFEMGLLDRSDWAGEWIGDTTQGGPRTGAPVPFLRRAVALTKQVASARLYATALGLYEFSINGRRVGEDLFTPGWTDYRYRVQYHSYDVTAHLQTGDNVLGIVLGDGWYCGTVAERGRQIYGLRPKVLAQVEIDYTDGSQETILTDTNWKTALGPILESDIYNGESYDARREMDGWDEPGFDDADWRGVVISPDPGVPIVAARGPQVRVQEELVPIAEPTLQHRWNGRDCIFDMGQNMVGRVRLKIRGAKEFVGRTLMLRFAEVLDSKGEMYTENLRLARATDYYTIRGEADEEVYEPRFTFHGFRYVQVTGFPGAPDRETVTGIVLSSDNTPTGEFECSDPLINQLQHNIVWGQKGNLLEVPTDCPQRDERLGWTGDAQVFVRTAAFNADVAGFFTKWLQDLRDTQGPRGSYHCVAPTNDLNDGDPDGGPAWTDAAIICPWTVYLCYNDTGIIKDNWKSMVRFMEFMKKHSVNYIRCHPDADVWEGFGDWLAIPVDTPKDLIGTAFFAYDASLMARMARALGKAAEAREYEALFNTVRDAFQRRFLSPDGLVVGNTQTARVLALEFNLVPEGQRTLIASDLARDIKSKGNHLSTGFVGTPYLANVLAQNGQLETAFALLHQQTWPSWLYSVTQGATTIWERWDGWTHDKGFQDAGMNSFNHYAYGAIGAWLYASLAGIDVDPERPGYKHILFRPLPGGGFTHARAELESVHGRIVSDWKIEGDRFIWNITVPTNATGAAWIPGKEGGVVTESGKALEEAEGVTMLRTEAGRTVVELKSGNYSFVSEL